MDEPRTRLAEQIKARRHALGLSQTQAAHRAGVARNTWATAEDGSRNVRSQNYTGIERALRWRAGSVDAILNGGDPTEEPTAPNDSPWGEARSGVVGFDLDAEIERIRSLDLPARTKLALVQRVLELFEEAQQEQERASAGSAG